MLQKLLSTGRKKPDLSMMTKTTSEDAGIQCTSNIACVNAHRAGQTSCSTVHQSLHYIGIGYLFIHLVSYHLRLTVCRATGPAAGEPIVSKTVLSLGHYKVWSAMGHIIKG